MKIKNSLKNKLIVSVFLTMLVIGFLTIFVLYFYLNNFFIENEKKSLETIAIEQAYEVLRVIEHSYQVADSVAKDEEIVKYLGGGYKDSQNGNIVKSLSRYNIADNYSSIFLLSKEGKILSSIDNLLVGQDYSSMGFFDETIKGHIRIDVFARDFENNDLLYRFSYPVIDFDGEILGVAVLELKDEVVGNTIRLFRKNKKIKKISLVDDYGIVIYSSDREDILKSITRLVNKEKEEVRDSENIDGFRVESLPLSLKREDITNISGQEAKTFEFVDESGEIIFAIISKLESFPFYVVVEQSKNESIIAAKQVIYVLFFVMLLSAIVSGFIIQFLISKVINRIINLDDTVNKSATGDIRQIVTVYNNDELGNLGKSFNDMITKLQKAMSESEGLVESKTALLEKTSKVMVGRELEMAELKEKIKESTDRNPK